MRAASTRHGKLDGGGYLGRKAVIRERTDEADRGVGCSRPDDGEVGVLGFVDLGKPIKTAVERDDSAAVAQGVKRVGVHAKGEHVAGAQRSALVAERIDGGVRSTPRPIGSSARCASTLPTIPRDALVLGKAAFG